MTELVVAEVGGEVVGGDVPCRKCGYNLRGLGVGGRCPECGVLVGLSVTGDLLRFSDPGWLRGLAVGVRWIIWGVVAVIVVTLGRVWIGRGVVAGLMGMGANGMILWGWWLMTRPDPSGLGEDQYGRARRWIRIGLVGGAVAAASGFVEQQTIGWPREVSLVAGVLGQLADVVGLFAQLQYLRKIARRIPDDRLERRANFLTYGLGSSYTLLILIGIFIMVIGFVGNASSAIMAVAFIAGLVGLVALVFGIIYLLMIERFGKRFKEQEGLAREAWGQDGLAQRRLEKVE